MEEICKEIEKVIKAGLGAVATGVEKAQEAVDQFAKKGEPIFEQAKTSVTDAADKLVKTISEIGKPKVADMLHDARDFSLEEMYALREGISQLILQKEAQQQAAPALMPTDE